MVYLCSSNSLIQRTLGIMADGPSWPLSVIVIDHLSGEKRKNNCLKKSNKLDMLFVTPSFIWYTRSTQDSRWRTCNCTSDLISRNRGVGNSWKVRTDKLLLAHRPITFFLLKNPFSAECLPLCRLCIWIRRGLLIFLAGYCIYYFILLISMVAIYLGSTGQNMNYWFTLQNNLKSPDKNMCFSVFEEFKKAEWVSWQ